jgi:predicted transcriptional regulator YdeE
MVAESGCEGGERLPLMMERYGPGFDPAIGRGDIEIWIPLAE